MPDRNKHHFQRHIFWIFLKIYGIVTSLFSKGVTLSGRLTVWNRGIQAFLMHPIVGTGIGTTPLNINYQQYHNKYLDFMVCGGIVLLLIFILYMIICCRKVDSYNNRMRVIGVLCLVSYCIMFIMEGTRTELFFWLIMSICYYHKDDIRDIGHIRKKYKLKEKRTINV